MLIIRNMISDSKSPCVEWNVGDEVPIAFNTNNIFYLDFHDKMSICADGNELAFILDNFKNIPRTNGEIQWWFGETAQYICINLASLPAASKPYMRYC